MVGQDALPPRTWRTGTEFFTILDAHPYHQPVGKVDHKGAGEYRMAYKAECPLCRAQGPAGLRRAETSRAQEARRPRPCLFVGDRRSRAAIRMDVTWYDGRLAAKTLFDVLEALGLSYEDYDVMNAYDDSGSLDVATLQAVKEAHARGWLIIGMGKNAQKALRECAIPHRAMIHPAARGWMRRRERYRAHVAEVLKEQ